MPQVLPLELQNYLVCCADGSYIPIIPEGDKFLFQGTSIPSNMFWIIQDYETGEFDSSTIETEFGVGVAGIQEVIITYINSSDNLSESIFVDTTTSTTFWNDIIGWLFLNNFYDLTYNVGLDKWLINDPLDLTFIEIVKP